MKVQIENREKSEERSERKVPQKKYKERNY